MCQTDSKLSNQLLYSSLFLSSSLCIQRIVRWCCISYNFVPADFFFCSPLSFHNIQFIFTFCRTIFSLSTVFSSFFSGCVLHVVHFMQITGFSSVFEVKMNEKITKSLFCLFFLFFCRSFSVYVARIKVARFYQTETNGSFLYSI